MLRRWWWDLPLRRKGAAVVAIPVVALLLTVLLLLGSARRSRIDRDWVNHTLEVEQQLTGIRTLLIEAETGVRGYVLVGDRSWLAPQERAASRVPAAIDALADMVRDNPVQLGRLDRLRTQANTRLESLQAMIDDVAFHDGRLTAKEPVQRGKALMDELLATLDGMLRHEDARLAERTARARQSQVRLFEILLLGALLGVGGALLTSYLFTNGVTSRIAMIAENARRIATGDEPRYPTIGGGDEVGQLARAVTEAGGLLEGRQRELTARLGQLAAVNEELEAFSYSVSHDLRAPLRHVSGFVSMLEQSANGTLDETSRRHLSRIGAAAQRMGSLIDDLLAFSRAGRATMAPSRVDLSAVVREAREELDPESAGRAIEWITPPLPTVAADPAMLRLVIVNLLSNAVKYTRPRDRARIEVTAAAREGETVVSVRDNGVGFDMQYAHKLFGVFQRLHRQEDFEGTGIGLANVRRIIARHGGRTWAEGWIDGGAVFSFSLPDCREAVR